MGARSLFRLTAVLIAAVVVPPVGAHTPTPGNLETYKDWTIGCDNRNRCEAVSLMREGGDWPDTPVMMGITREAGGTAEPEVWISWDAKDKETVNFLVDGRPMGTVTSSGGEASVKGAQAATLAVAMAKGGALELRSGHKSIGKPSLAGLAAALRYMDARQGRAGTTAALVAVGALGRGAVKPAPPELTIRRALVPAGSAPSALWREELATLGKFTGCAEEMQDASPPELHRLSKTETLVLVPCGAGAYNFSSVPVIASGIAGRRTFRLAGFDFQPGWSEDAAKPMLVNADWSADTSTLQSYAKGRGLGDCGGSETYVWDGVRFRLIEASAMGECRGSWHWIRTWTAKAVDPS